MKKKLLSGLVAAAVLGTMALPVAAQNLAIVNGKAVPKERAEVLKQQVERSGRPVTPELENQIKEEVIAREIFMQEAQKRGLEASPDFKVQMDMAREAELPKFDDIKAQIAQQLQQHRLQQYQEKLRSSAKVE